MAAGVGDKIISLFVQTTTCLEANVITVLGHFLLFRAETFILPEACEGGIGIPLY